MSEPISLQRRTGHSGSKRQCQLHSRCRLLHRHHLRGQSGKDGASNPAPAGEATEGYPPPHQLSCTRCMRIWKPTPHNPRHQHPSRPQGPHLTMTTRMRDGRQLRGSPTGKERREGQGRHLCDRLIGGNRDIRPQKVRKPKKGSEPSTQTERQRRGGKGSGRVSP